MTINLGIIHENIVSIDNIIFIDIVMECANILSITDILFIPILIDFNNNNFNQANLEIIFNEYPECNQFIYAGKTPKLNMIIDEYFRYYPEKILYSVDSSRIGSDYNDNVFRLLPNDYGLINFIANIYLKNNNFDLFYFTGSFYTEKNENGVIDYFIDNQGNIDTTQFVINEFLKSINKTIVYNPIPFSTNTLDDFNNTLKINMARNEYYTTNCYTVLNIPYVPNTNAIQDSEFYSEYYSIAPSLFFKVSDKAISSYNNGVITYSDNRYIPQIEKFISYLLNFNYTTSKKIVVFISYAEFPILLAKIASRFSIDFIETMKNNLVFILSTFHNRDEYTWDLFNNAKTNMLWYNNGYTWYKLLELFNVKIHFPRTDQSMFYLYLLLNEHLKTIYSGYDFKLDKTAQPSIEAVFNALNLLYHFNKNNIDIRSYITSYFQNSKLLQFQNNLVLNSNMDSIYGVYVATTFFFEGETAIGSRIYNLIEQQNIKELNNEQINSQLTRATVTNQTVKAQDQCKPVTTIIEINSRPALKLALCERKLLTCGSAIRTSKNDRLLKNTCYRCSAALCKTYTQANN